MSVLYHQKANCSEHICTTPYTISKMATLRRSLQLDHSCVPWTSSRCVVSEVHSYMQESREQAAEVFDNSTLRPCVCMQTIWPLSASDIRSSRWRGSPQRRSSARSVPIAVLHGLITSVSSRGSATVPPILLMLVVQVYGAAVAALICREHRLRAPGEVLNIIEIGGGTGTLAADILVRSVCS